MLWSMQTYSLDTPFFTPMPATTEHKTLAPEPMTDEGLLMEDGMAADKLFNGIVCDQSNGERLIFSLDHRLHVRRHYSYARPCEN